ncbi:MAG: S-layer homology domain-containing protein, partial [Clostridia bacterium]
KKVTITGVAKKNAASTEVKYELVVKKADNLCINGDLTEDTVQGWFPKDNTVLSIIKDNEENVLNSSGTGAYQVLTLTNDSSYGFVAKVKATKGSKIRLVSEKGGTIAEVTATGDYQDIKASYDYRKQKSSFEDKIYLEYNGELQIKQLKVFEITLELNKVSSAVNKAVYSKSSTDINDAKKLVLAFYDLPIREELLDKLSSINPSSGSSSGGGGGGGGGGSSSPSKSTSPADVKTDTGTVAIPPQDKNEIEKTEDELDTYLLRFKDMKNHWAREDVEYMAELGIVNGDENDKFRPEDRVSRAEFATMISKAMGLDTTEYENSFFDVVSDDWYSGYVQTVRSNDYMSGYDGLFKPNADITREEIARVIVAAYNSKTNTKLEKGKSLYFNDLDDISYWAYDYIVEAADMGFIYGMTDELFAPKQPATRAQAAVMIKRVYDKLHPTAE